MTVVDERPTTPAEAPRRRPNRLLALLRNSWRQLTSMRTALVLLFLLAVAAVPGSVLPQRNISPEKVNEYFVEHPDLAPRLDRIGAFEVFGSVWFSAIYLLLFTSLIGCITPRMRDHVRALRSKPPAAPKRLDRLPQHAVLPLPEGGVPAIVEALRRRRWRVAVRGNEVSAEKGYLKETGNLVFHISMVVVLAGVALGHWYGWSGNRLLVAGEDNAFCNTRQQYAEAKLGPRVDSAHLPGFCLVLDRFEARFLESGQPDHFNATVTVEEPGKAPRSADFSVNSPLRLDGANVYLLGHGYAPVIRYTDRYGKSQVSDEPFLTTGDAGLTGEGLAAFPDANVDPKTGRRDSNLQVAFTGLYLPTAPEAPPYVRSQYPAERNPALNLVAYRGNLGLDAGIPGSVYELDERQIRTGKVKQIGDKVLRPGESWKLDDGTTVEFLGTKRYVTLSVRHDPGSGLLLVSCGFLLAGLMGSLFGRRRRVFFRVTTPGDADPAGETPTSGSSLVEAGGLPRTDYPGFADEFAQLVAAVGGGGRPDEAAGTGRDGHDRAGTREGTD
ncbi:cytochrome c biogenesis protein ResB [Micromonospora globbae]|jgi:cytochrome c biogenesis protein|uniref:Cytochrome c biogenesis protein ResB n=1 Tax=Micromonospora globbae TaxID=1894969 RepID=A0A420F4M6_9ACTN|nr:cytochrome c biogenesis protein ResB [Micromonospora globbae]RKF27873.1 cytochrome c biogenesis protein ResB [Micromonospora globbae]WTF86635.1 cytochrome c biogenesis protein ResB [Micromonospora globbae]